MGCKLNNHCEFSDEDLVKAFAIFDTNGDGQMDNMEFFAAMTYLGLTQNYLSIDTSSIKDKFQDFDQDGDGKICIDGNN
jgi:Ca2+-binding EF-hand superfamily protein